MSPARATAAVVLVGTALVLCSVSCWGIAAIKLLRKSPLLPWSPRKPVPWALIDLVAIVSVYLLVGLTLHQWKLVPGGKTETLTLAEKQAVVVANIGLSLGVVALGLVMLVVRCGANSRDLGWSGIDVRNDLKLGVIGFVMLAPPVYGLQGLLVTFWQKSEHPIIEMFKDDPNGRFFGLLFVSAAVAAPLFEEIVFRMLLQGFLEKVTTFQGNPVELLFSGARPVAVAAILEPLPGDAVAIDPNPYAPPRDSTAEVAAHAASGVEQPELRGPLAWLPIAVSSAIFALLHYSHGPDWIPLLILAAGMGYLYQRTHRLLPSLVVHALLNATSMAGVWVAVKQGL